MKLGWTEILLIAFVVLLLFGGKKIPELMRGLGRGVREFKDAKDNVKKELGHFKYDGRLIFDGEVKGKLKDGKLPLIEVSFSCANAWLHNMQANKKVDSLGFQGYYTNGPDHSLKTSELRLLNMNARPGKGIFKGNFIMRDFTDPKILMQVN